MTTAEARRSRSPAPSGSSEPLVSILIPAYKPDHFAECLASAMNQTWANIEILICDDSEDDRISEIVNRMSADDDRVRYVRNRPHLGGRGNYLKCFELARGELIKYLNDDDLLMDLSKL